MNRKLSEQILNNIDDEYIAEAINYTYTRQKKEPPIKY